ncbi:MAG: serine/threonine-protein kinase, partial [Gemmatimonadaceae bacterium]
MSNTQVGRTIGDYRLEAVIGAGNLGTVYQATALRDNTPAAVKIVHDTLTGDPGFPDRFKGVGGAAAALQHPNVVRVLACGNAGEDYYLAMELLARGSLRSMLERRDDRPSLGRTVDLIRQAAEALGYAHSQRVIHRDIKPENIMLARADASAGGGAVRVVDFGMMQLIDTGVTMVGRNAPGSPRYMSPEQCAGKPPEARSDIYSLGVVLYEAATGYPPFQVNTMAEAIDKHLSAMPASPRSVNNAIPAELERVILRCLAKKADDRYASA